MKNAISGGYNLLGDRKMSNIDNIALRKVVLELPNACLANTAVYSSYWIPHH